MRAPDDVPADEGARLLRRLDGRSTWLVDRGVGPARVVKIWHGRGTFAAWRDARRARAEHAVLAEASRRGWPVPAPISLSRDGRGWRLEMEAIEGATPLARSWDGEARASAALVRVARLLGEMQAGGATFGDAHAGNFVLDAAGRPFAVDLAKVRFRDVVDVTRAFREATRLAGEAQERVPARVARAAGARWWRALGGRAVLGALRPTLAALAAHARRDRRRRVRRQVDRWWRESGRCRAIGAETLARRELDEAVVERLVAAAAGARSGDGVRAGDGFFVALRARDGRERRVLARAWSANARLADHAVPAALPAVLVRGAASLAWFELPGDARAADGSLTPDVRVELALRGLAGSPAPAPLASDWISSDGARLLVGDLRDGPLERADLRPARWRFAARQGTFAPDSRAARAIAGCAINTR